MGIKGLSDLLDSNCKDHSKIVSYNQLFNRVIAIDAANVIYPFLVAIRTGPSSSSLTDQDGNTTSHLQGIFYRTLKMMENGIKPVYVFDGTAPPLKFDELEGRRKRAQEATDEANKLVEEGASEEEISKFKKRSQRINSTHVKDTKEMLRLMGVPIVESPSEGEAQASQMCKDGLCWAVATEDMDTLTFGAPRMLRKFNYAASRKEPIQLIIREKCMDGLSLSDSEFIDLSILMGCDYVKKIRGIGSQSAYNLIKKYKNLENILEYAKIAKTKNTKKGEPPKLKYVVPPSLEKLYPEVRRLFSHPDIIPSKDIELKWKKPKVKKLIKFLCDERQFDHTRISSRLQKYLAFRKTEGKQQQTRLTSFFSAREPREIPLTETDKKKVRKT